MARQAHSFDILDKELNELYPGTTTWEVGDDDHKNTWSDHNANKAGVYCGKDVLGNAGLNLRKFVNHLLAERHPNLRYVIFDGEIMERGNNFKPEPYKGRSKHKTHVHLSVGNGPDGRSTSGYDSKASWYLNRMGSTKPTKPQQPKPTEPNESWFDNLMSDLPETKKGATGLPVNRIQALVNIAGAGLKEDGKFGDNTEREVKDFQRNNGLEDDGIVGPKTWSKLLTWKW